MNPNAQNFDDEISLFELVDVLRKRWIWVVTLALVSATAALVVCQFIPNQYQASTIIQIGRLGNLTTNPGSSSEIESPQALAERINTSGFAELIAKAGGDAVTIKANANKNTKLVKIDIRASSAHRAIQTSETIIQTLQKDHQLLAEPIERALTKSISQQKSSLKEIDQLLLQFNRQGQEAEKLKTDPLSYIIFSQALQKLNDRRVEILEKLDRVEGALLEQTTFRTSNVAPIYVSDRPVYPKVTQVTLVALFAGGFLGVLVVFVISAYQSRCKTNR